MDFVFKASILHAFGVFRAALAFDGVGARWACGQLGEARGVQGTAMSVRKLSRAAREHLLALLGGRMCREKCGRPADAGVDQCVSCWRVEFGVWAGRSHNRSWRSLRAPSDFWVKP